MTYFVRIRGKAFGPFDEEQLQNMKTQGKLSRTTEVSENKTDWQSAESLEFLFPPSSTNTTSKVVQEPTDWFYSTNGTDASGPVTVTSIEQMLRSGQLSINSYVWQQGQKARLIKNEPLFFGHGGETQLLKKDTEDIVAIGGEITGTSEQVDTGKMLRPIAATLGWLMFLKITFLLVGIIAQGLYLLLANAYAIPYALAKDDAMVLLVILVLLALNAALYALQFKTFLCFWKYHTDLYKVVATGRAADLTKSNQSQFLFWKWLGITVIVHLAVILVTLTTTLIIAGLTSGVFQRFLP